MDFVFPEIEKGDEAKHEMKRKYFSIIICPQSLDSGDLEDIFLYRSSYIIEAAKIMKSKKAH